MAIHADVLVVGSGLAGLFVALNINPDKEVILLAKEKIDHSSSMLAQGGIAAEMDDTPVNLESHVKDTMEAGSYHNQIEAVRFLVENARNVINKLIDYGVSFDMDDSDGFLFTKEGGHTRRRVLHIGGDRSGFFVTKALQKKIMAQPNITLIDGAMALDLIVNEETCMGATILTDSKYKAITATHTVLATGGIGSVYGSTTNDLSATGDGIGMVDRVGVPTRDMEFIQFHPTAFHDESNKSRKKFLITEALRGEGAYLINIDHERFMQKYDPKRMELAPRDIVSQAIFREMYDTWTDHVYLDTRHLETEILQKRFPGIDKHIRKNGLMLGRDLIPVSPCEHFLCGGIETDLKGKTRLDGLFAVGETAYTGVHGANRLASNSLLECIVFGDEIAKNINVSNIRKKPRAINDTLHDMNEHQFNYKPIRKKIGDLMDEHVGIVRTKKGLQSTHKILSEIKENLIKEPNRTRPYYETLNMVTTAMKINEQALNRKESIGCHLRIN